MIIHRTHPLTPREIAVLTGVMQGKTDKAIGRELGLAYGTVKVHVKTILRKLQVRTRTEAAVLMVQRRHELSRASPSIQE
jgi:DNA-binding NarL/FixJ family response regulator